MSVQFSSVTSLCARFLHGPGKRTVAYSVALRVRCECRSVAACGEVLRLYHNDQPDAMRGPVQPLTYVTADRQL